jgi:hypothetical protein
LRVHARATQSICTAPAAAQPVTALPELEETLVTKVAVEKVSIPEMLLPVIIDAKVVAALVGDPPETLATKLESAAAFVASPFVKSPVEVAPVCAVAVVVLTPVRKVEVVKILTVIVNPFTVFALTFTIASVPSVTETKTWGTTVNAGTKLTANVPPPPVVIVPFCTCEKLGVKATARREMIIEPSNLPLSPG